MVRETKSLLLSATVAASVFGFYPESAEVNAAELLMIEEKGCFWCEAWNKDISQVYPKTSEGQSAPLRRVDIKSDIEQQVTLKQSVHFTPTFLLIEDGKEVGRIEGYPGEDFFWGILGKILKDLPEEVAAISSTSR